ncbi:hypothetical protein [Streptomyces sp. NBC_00344]|uniref:hypothetical protein n=1 Tax=Streptomyces sp. NBC_00344 TaxID=2975720 RepID=UPI002E20F868
MATHAAVPAPRRQHLSTAAWALPVGLGVAYGFYAAYIQSSGHGLSTAQLVVSLVSGIALAALAFGLGRIQHRMSRELRSAAYGVLFGGAMGFLYSMTGESVLLSSFIGAGLGAGMLITVFYLLYTHEA